MLISSDLRVREIILRQLGSQDPKYQITFALYIYNFQMSFLLPAGLGCDMGKSLSIHFHYTKSILNHLVLFFACISFETSPGGCHTYLSKNNSLIYCLRHFTDVWTLRINCSTDYFIGNRQKYENRRAAMSVLYKREVLYISLAPHAFPKSLKAICLVDFKSFRPLLFQ